MTDDDAVSYGREAAAVLGNRAYQDAFTAIEKVLVDELAKSDISTERAEHVRMLLSLGRRYRKYMEKAMADGSFASTSMLQEEQRRRFWQRNAA
jgi:hypothetical protein